MQGRVCVITGGTDGIGRVTAEDLARAGAEVIVVGRNPEKTRGVVDAIRASTSNPLVNLEIADLAEREQVADLSNRLLERCPKLHVLVNNAGGIFSTRRLTSEGHEYTFSLNHLAYFHLTLRLLERLEASGDARIVSTSSSVHTVGRMVWDDLHFERSVYGWGWPAYFRSKLANVLMTRELARRLEGRGVTATCHHPGYVSTRFNRNNGMVAQIGMGIGSAFARNATRGADTMSWLAMSPDVRGASGGYYHDRKEVRPGRVARQDLDARKLWDVSLGMTGLE